MLQEELDEKDRQLRAAKEELKNIDRLKANIERLNSEREAVKSQVEDLIRELDSVEL
jgi:uncharacterized protein (UPF0335 family)